MDRIGQEVYSERHGWLIIAQVFPTTLALYTIEKNPKLVYGNVETESSNTERQIKSKTCQIRRGDKTFYYSSRILAADCLFCSDAADTMGGLFPCESTELHQSQLSFSRALR